MGQDRRLLDALNAVTRVGIISKEALQKTHGIIDLSGVEYGGIIANSRKPARVQIARLLRQSMWWIDILGRTTIALEGGSGAARGPKSTGRTPQTGLGGKVRVASEAHFVEYAWARVMSEQLDELRAVFSKEIDIVQAQAEGDFAAASVHQAQLNEGRKSPTFVTVNASASAFLREYTSDQDAMDLDDALGTADELLACARELELVRDSKGNALPLVDLAGQQPQQPFVFGVDSDYLWALAMSSVVVRDIARIKNEKLIRIAWYNVGDAWRHYVIDTRALLERWIRDTSNRPTGRLRLAAKSPTFKRRAAEFDRFLRRQPTSATADAAPDQTSADPLDVLHTQLTSEGQIITRDYLTLLVVGVAVNGLLWRDYTPLDFNVRCGIGAGTTLYSTIVILPSLADLYDHIEEIGLRFYDGQVSLGRSALAGVGHFGLPEKWSKEQDHDSATFTIYLNQGPGVAKLARLLVDFASSLTPAFSPNDDYSSGTDLYRVLSRAPSLDLPSPPAFLTSTLLFDLAIFLRQLPSTGMSCFDARALIGTAVPGDLSLRSVFVDRYPDSVWQALGGGPLVSPVRTMIDDFIRISRTISISAAMSSLKLNCDAEAVDRLALRGQRLNRMLAEQLEEGEEVIDAAGAEQQRQETLSAWVETLARRFGREPLSSDEAAEFGKAHNGVSSGDLKAVIAGLEADILRPGSGFMIRASEGYTLSWDFRTHAFGIADVGNPEMHVRLLKIACLRVGVHLETKNEYSLRRLLEAGISDTRLSHPRFLQTLLYAPSWRAVLIVHLMKIGTWDFDHPDRAAIDEHINNPCADCPSLPNPDIAFWLRSLAKDLGIPPLPFQTSWKEQARRVQDPALIAQLLAFERKEMDPRQRTTAVTVRRLEAVVGRLGIAKEHVQRCGAPALGKKRLLPLWRLLQNCVSERVGGDRELMRKAMGPLIDEAQTGENMYPVFEQS